MKTLEQMIAQEESYVTMKSHELKMAEKAGLKTSDLGQQMHDDHKQILGWLKELQQTRMNADEPTMALHKIKTILESDNEDKLDRIKTVIDIAFMGALSEDN